MLDSCASLVSPSIANFWLSVVLAAGIVLSYIPQHVRIIARKSSEGISPYFLLLGFCSGLCAFENILLLSGPITGCCAAIGAFNCFASLLGIIQVGLQFVASGFILVFAEFCAPLDDAPVKKRIHQVALTCFAFTIVTALLAGVIYNSDNESLIDGMASVFGLLATAMAMMQYLPQIWTTYVLKHTGSLSIAMMCLQTPGGYLWSASLYFREGTKWSSWMPYFASATCQGILLAMAIYYEYFDKSNERAPLLTTGEAEPSDFREPVY